MLNTIRINVPTSSFAAAKDKAGCQPNIFTGSLHKVPSHLYAGLLWGGGIYLHECNDTLTIKLLRGRVW